MENIEIKKSWYNKTKTDPDDPLHVRQIVDTDTTYPMYTLNIRKAYHLNEDIPYKQMIDYIMSDVEEMLELYYEKNIEHKGSENEWER
jgi:hypothetical protein